MTRLILVVAIGVLLTLPVTARAQRRSAAQCTADGSAVLINKAVGDQIWVVTYTLPRGETTGNVLSPSGVEFLSCRQDSIVRGKIGLRCAATTACTSTACPTYGPPIPVTVDCSFFAAPCRRPIRDDPSGENSVGCDCGTLPQYPCDSEASCEAFAASLECATFNFEGTFCLVGNCCSTAPLECPQPAP